MLDFLTQTAWGFKLVYLLGIINIVGIVLIFFSCRCLVQPKIFQKLLTYSWYRWFYKQHCWLWRIFFVSVILHSTIALMLFGNPF